MARISDRQPVINQMYAPRPIYHSSYTTPSPSPFFPTSSTSSSTSTSPRQPLKPFQPHPQQSLPFPTHHPNLSHTTSPTSHKHFSPCSSGSTSPSTSYPITPPLSPPTLSLPLSIHKPTLKLPNSFHRSKTTPNSLYQNTTTTTSTSTGNSISRKLTTSSKAKIQAVQLSLELKVERSKGFHSFYVPIGRPIPSAPPSSPVLEHRSVSHGSASGSRDMKNGEGDYFGCLEGMKLKGREEWVENVNDGMDLDP